MPPALGLYTCINHETNCIKSDFKDMFLKLTTNEWSDKTFLLTSKLCPLRAVCLRPRGYIHVSSHENNYIKSDFKEFCLKLVIRPFCLHHNFVIRGLSAPCPGPIYMYQIMKTSSPKGNDRSPESNVPRSNLISKTYKWAMETTGPKSNSSELLCLSWLPATLMTTWSKMNELACRHHFPIISL